MGLLRNDLRSATTLIAIAALALGIGANTAIFTVVNRVLLMPLSYPQPDRIVEIIRSYPGSAGYVASIPKFLAWRQGTSFEALAAYDFTGPGLSIGGELPTQVKGIHVSAGWTGVFGVKPFLGRSFTEEEDRPGGAGVAVISHGLWVSRFGADPEIVGRSVTLSGDPHVVVGVMPPGFETDPAADVWLPLRADPASANEGNFLRVAARLKPGVTLRAAQAELQLIGERFRAAHPTAMDRDEGVSAIPLRDFLVGDVRPALLILSGAVGLVLLIACVNVANLLLARAAGRQKELAIRIALGASRMRIVRQLMNESLQLAVAGGLLGLVLGAWGVRALLALSPGRLPRLTGAVEVQSIPLLDWRVLAFTAAVSIATGILFGILPALQASNTDVNSILKESGRSVTGLKQNRTRGVLVVTEVALALVLLAGAMLLIRSFEGLRSVDPGFDPHNVLTFQTSMKGARYATTAQVDNLIQQALDRIEALPGVQSAAAAFSLPAVGPSFDLPMTIAGRPLPPGSQYTANEQWVPVTPHYFATFRIALQRGRLFQRTDTGHSTPVMLINAAMARKYWPTQDPIGQSVVVGGARLGPELTEPARVIVGIVSNARNNSLDQADPPVMYVPKSQVIDSITQLANNALPASWAVRTQGNPLRLRDSIEQELRHVDGQFALANVLTMEQVLARATARQSFNAILLSVFAATALLLAAIGIYGVMAYSVAQRRQEIGIRMALGAARSDMLQMVLAQGLRLALTGVSIGTAAAFGMTRLLAGLLFGVKPWDPLTFGAVSALLLAIALIASLAPAWRATRVDPATALR